VIEHNSRDHHNSSIEAVIVAKFRPIHARASIQESNILPIDTEIERTIWQKPRDNVEEEEEEFNIEEETMAKQLVIQTPLE
jgi:hypothetical protein